MNDSLTPPKRGPRPATIALAVVLALLAGAAGFVGVGSVLQRRSVPQFVGSLFVEQPQEHFHKDHLAVLLVGLDYNYTASDIEFSGAARTDSIKAIELNFPTASNPKGSIAMISVPRDMDVVLPNGREDRINSAYTTGGIAESKQVVANFLGIPVFDRYITLRIDAAKSLVDAIGGIDVVPAKTMNYDDSWGHLHIHFTGGKKVHMNGEQAVSYSRFRHDECGDPCRIQRQDQVLKITIAKLKNDRFNDLMHMGALIDVLRKNVDTDLTDREALSIANAFSQVDLKNVAMAQVPYTTDKQLACCGNVIVADDAAKTALVKRLLTPPIAPSVPAGPAAVAEIAPSSIHVEVENGSGATGAAARIATKLRSKGFTVGAIGDADRFDYPTTQIRVHATARALDGERVRSSLGVASAVVSPLPASSALGAATPPADVTVIVGRDYSARATEASAVR